MNPNFSQPLIKLHLPIIILCTSVFKMMNLHDSRIDDIGFINILGLITVLVNQVL